jgi:hypothetical protein
VKNWADQWKDHRCSTSSHGDVGLIDKSGFEIRIICLRDAQELTSRTAKESQTQAKAKIYLHSFIKLKYLAI